MRAVASCLLIAAVLLSGSATAEGQALEFSGSGKRWRVEMKRCGPSPAGLTCELEITMLDGSGGPFLFPTYPCTATEPAGRRHRATGVKVYSNTSPLTPLPDSPQGWGNLGVANTWARVSIEFQGFATEQRLVSLLSCRVFMGDESTAVEFKDIAVRTHE